MVNFLVEGAQSAIDFSTIDTSSIVPTVLAAVGVVLGVVFTVIAIDLGIKKAKKHLKSA